MTLMTPYGAYVAPATANDEHIPPRIVLVNGNKFIRTSDRNTHQSIRLPSVLTIDDTSNVQFNTGDFIQGSRDTTGAVTIQVNGAVSVRALGKPSTQKTFSLIGEGASFHLVKVSANFFRLTGLIE